MSNLQERMREAFIAMKSERWADARSILMQVMQAERHDPEGWHRLGVCHARLGALTDAVESFNRCLALEPEHVFALLGLGNALIQLRRFGDAITTLQKAVSLQPASADAGALLGNALLMDNRFAEAEQSLRKVLELNPDHCLACYHLGLTCLQMRRYADAMEYLHKALPNKNLKGGAYNAIGNVYERSGELEKAVEHYEAAVRLCPGTPEPAVNLGLTLEKLHRAEAADRAAQIALHIDNNHPGANLLHGRLERRAKRYAHAISSLRKALSPDLPPGHYSAAASELALVLDRLGRYDEAFEAFTRGNDVWVRILQSQRLDPDEYIRHIEANRQWFTPEQVRGWGASFRDAVPAPVFLVGFPRSGTTLMEQILESHPALIGSREAPILASMQERLEDILGRAFSLPADLATLSESELLGLRKYYWDAANRALGGGLDESRLVDKLPLNIVELGFVNRLFPEARIITALRDPRDCCLSCFMQAFELNRAMAHFLTLGSAARLYSHVMGLWLHYRKSLTITMFDYRYEDLVADLPGVASQVFDFIGVDWDERVLNYHETANKRYANTPSYQAVTRPVYTSALQRWRHYEKYIVPHLDVLRPYIQCFGYDE